MKNSERVQVGKAYEQIEHSEVEKISAKAENVRTVRKKKKSVQEERNKKKIRELRKEFKGLIYEKGIKDTIRYIRGRMLKDLPNNAIPGELLQRFGTAEKSLRLSDDMGYTLEEVAKKIGRNAKDVSLIENATFNMKKVETFLFYLESFSIIYDCSPLYFVKKNAQKDIKDIYMGTSKRVWKELIAPMKFDASGQAGEYLNATLVNLCDGSLPSDEIELNERLLDSFGRMLKSRHAELYNEIRSTIIGYFKVRKTLIKVRDLRLQAKKLSDENLGFYNEKISERASKWLWILAGNLHMRQTAPELFFRISQTDSQTKRLICGWIEGELELRNIDANWSK